MILFILSEWCIRNDCCYRRRHYFEMQICINFLRFLNLLGKSLRVEDREVLICDCEVVHRPAITKPTFYFVLFIKNVVNRGTGLPVAPLSLPLFQAVPAMSKCAHVYFLVNRSRKHAAVMLPPAGPPMFAMSAKFDLSCSW